MKKFAFMFALFITASLFSCGHSTTANTEGVDTDTVAVDSVDTVVVDTVF